MGGVKSSIPEYNKDLEWMGSITVVLKKGRNGYGFAVTGSSPAIISRVQSESPAETAGLQKGDCIVKINGQNVSRSMADSVAKIIKQSDKQIVVDIQRPTLSIPVSQTSALTPIPEQPCAEETVWVHQSDVNSEEDCDMSRRSGRLQDDSLSLSPSHLSSTHCTPHHSPMSLGSSPGQVSPSSGCHGSFSSPGATSSDDSYQDGNYDNQDNVEEKRSSTHIPDDVNLTFQCLGSGGQERQAAIATLRSQEAEFVRVMHCGIERYSDPLRDFIISPSEHTTLFQNVEKLVEFSETHLQQLAEHSIPYTHPSSDSESDRHSSDSSPEAERYTSVVGSVYKTLAPTMATAYESYCNGIKSSFRLLIELREDEEFNQFTKKSKVEPGEPSISQFIQRPLQHIKDMVLSLQKIAVNTSRNHHDYEAMKTVILLLRNACNRINESNTRRSRSNLSVTSQSHTPSVRSRCSVRQASRTPSCHGGSERGSHTSEQSQAPSEASSGGQSMMSIASVDTEVLNIQGRLVFPHHMPAFQLATATRHMIYSGELMYFDGLLWNRLYVVLLSDLLLLTRPDPDGYLSVLHDPIILHTIDGINYDSPTPGEFSLSQTNIENPLVFQAPTSELKSTWTHILEQRVMASRAQLLMDNSIDNIV